jgi:hypothetical protein
MTAPFFWSGAALILLIWLTGLSASLRCPPILVGTLAAAAFVAASVYGALIRNLVAGATP